MQRTRATLRFTFRVLYALAESTADTQRQLQPALLSLSAMISQYFTNPTSLVDILNHLRYRFAQFKLCADLLNLGGLLSELGCESLYLFLLLRDRCFQLLNFAIEHGGATRRAGGGNTLVARANIPAKLVGRKV